MLAVRLHGLRPAVDAAPDRAARSAAGHLGAHRAPRVPRAGVPDGQLHLRRRRQHPLGPREHRPAHPPLDRPRVRLGADHLLPADVALRRGRAPRRGLRVRRAPRGRRGLGAAQPAALDVPGGRRRTAASCARSQERSFAWLDGLEPGRHALVEVPGYTHLDVFFGRDAERDVFGHVVAAHCAELPTPGGVRVGGEGLLWKPQHSTRRRVSVASRPTVRCCGCAPTTSSSRSSGWATTTRSGPSTTATASACFAYTRQMLGGSRSDAEDVLQDVFLRAYGALRNDDRPVTLRAWLYRVAHNRCIDHLRRPRPAGGRDLRALAHAGARPARPRRRAARTCAAWCRTSSACPSSSARRCSCASSTASPTPSWPTPWTPRCPRSSRCSCARASASSRPARRATRRAWTSAPTSSAPTGAACAPAGARAGTCATATAAASTARRCAASTRASRRSCRAAPGRSRPWPSCWASAARRRAPRAPAPAPAARPPCRRRHRRHRHRDEGRRHRLLRRRRRRRRGRGAPARQRRRARPPRRAPRAPRGARARGRRRRAPVKAPLARAIDPVRDAELAGIRAARKAARARARSTTTPAAATEPATGSVAAPAPAAGGTVAPEEAQTGGAMAPDEDAMPDPSGTGAVGAPSPDDPAATPGPTTPPATPPTPGQGSRRRPRPSTRALRSPGPPRRPPAG